MWNKYKHTFYALGLNMIPIIVLNLVAFIMQSYGYATTLFECGGLVVYGVTLFMGFVMALQAKKSSEEYDKKLNVALKEFMGNLETLYSASASNAAGLPQEFEELQHEVAAELASRKVIH